VSWVKIDDNFATHWKFQEASPEAIKFYIAALCYCARYLTDGQIDPKRVEGQAQVKFTKPLLRSLLKLDLLEQREDGTFWIHDYLEYNPSREHVLAGQKANAERQERWRKGRRNAVTNGVSNALVTAPRPVPLNTYARASQRRAQPVDKPTPVPPPFVDDGNTGIPCPPDLRAQMGLDA
jgi:hypothetical protein